MAGSRRPETLLLMEPGAFRTQFGPAELARLDRLAKLGSPQLATDLRLPEVRRRLAEVEVLITSWGCPVLDREVVEAAPELRAVFHAAGTVRPHVSDAVFERDILVTTAAGINAEPVAQYTLAAILWSFKKVPFLAANPQICRETWSYADRRGEYTGLSAADRTVVLVGFSRIGRRVAQLLQPFDLRVVVVDPVVDPALVTAAGALLCDLETALPHADVLSIHAPLLPSTRNMIGAAELAALPPNATLINTARGGLVDHEALEQACLLGLHAVLDVTEPEPLPDHCLLYQLPNVLITPHIAGSLGPETRRMADAALTELEHYISGKPAECAVTQEALTMQA